MAASLPTIEAIQEIESRQDEVLRMLDELEKRIAQTLAAFGDQRFIKSAELGNQRVPANAELGTPNFDQIAKAA